jgi:hypothetical protein
MAIVKPFQVNNGLEVSLNANVGTTVTAADFIGNATAPVNPPSLVFDFAKSEQLDPKISFVRSSSATYTAANGRIVTANSNVPRFEYANGISRGLLIEDQRTNIYWDSYATNISAAFNNLAVVGNTTAPTGTNTAPIVSSPSPFFSLISPNRPAYAKNTVYTRSVYVKPISGSNAIFWQAIVNSSVYSVSSFNLNNGVASVDANARVSMINVGDGWWRCIHTLKTDPSADLAGDSIFIGGYGSTDIPTTMAVWGWQSEVGTEATSLIETPPLSSATRASDVVTVGINATSTWYSATTGTCYGEYTLRTQGAAAFPGVGYAPGYPQMFGFFNISDPNNMVMAHYQGWPGQANSLGGSTSGALSFLNYNNPTSAATGNYTNVDSVLTPPIFVTIGSTTKAAFSYSSNNMNFSANGTSNTFSYTGNNIIATNLFLMQSARFQGQPAGYFKKFIYYPSKLTEAQLRYLTTT